ncbi:unnamed protein product [Withania somnifera]
MEKAFPFFLFIGLLFIHYVTDSSSMTPTNTTTDQLTLLSLKSQIVSDPSHLLNESWTPANSVCHWVGVSCGSRHQRVKSLNLSGMALTGRIPRDFGNLTFLVSIDLGSNNFQGILPQEMARLRRLKYLDLRFNNLSGDVPSWLGFLHQLQVLNLGNNSFTGSIPSSFSNISTLETLNLKFNSIEGQIPEVIGSLTSLRVLNLKGNKLTGFIPLSISNASRLETLEISFNSLQGNISEEIGNLHNMNTLSIQFNKLTGSIPFTIFNISRIEIIAFTNNSLSGDLPNGLCSGLSILKGLYLSENKLHGHIPTSLSNCSQLQLLGLSENEFDGPIHSEIGRLSNLHSLSLGSNHFTGIIPEEIRNLINLVELGMEKNQITGSIPISIFNISSLQLLSLARNNLIGLLPREIGNLTKMENLDFSENRFTGEIPKEIRNLMELEILSLHDNTFSGPLDMEIFNISGLRVIDLSANNLTGTLPPNIGSILPNIEGLFLHDLTNLVGIIPHSISNCSKLTILGLPYNKLTGMIPNSLGYLTHLQTLNLEGNNLTSDSSLSFMTSLSNCRNLTHLYLGSNPLTGMLPASMGNFSTSLLKFSARSCKINGRIPNEVGNLSSLIFLDLSGNNLVGSISLSIGNLRNLQRLQLYDNKLTGFIGDNICKLQQLSDIYLGQNQLSGSLPYCFGNVSSLREIHLNSNKLSSNIPASIGNLKDLIVLDLSSNNMVGSLPLEIGNMKAATPIDCRCMVKYPRRVLSRTSRASFSSTMKHCGSSRFYVPPCTTSSKHISNEKKLLVLFLLLGLAPCFVPITFLSISIRYRRVKGAPQQEFHTMNCSKQRMSLARVIDWIRKFWLVYKGVLRSGTAIAIKVFNLQLEAAFKSFDTECEVLRGLRHRNLVKVISSCSNLDFKALVLEYMPNGSLEKYLYSHNYFLNISRRLSIMIDVACALEYLHHGCSNVLMNENMVAHLSDFGISKLLGEDESDLYTKTLATLGYIAPEYGLDGLVSTKCDVFSYGIMLLETFTGRKPNEFEGDLSLKQWVSYSLPEAIMDVVDANLVTPIDNRLRRTRRSNMKDVVGMLRKIKIQLLT